MMIHSLLLNAIRGPRGLRFYSYSWKVTGLQCNNVGRVRELCENGGGCPRLPVRNRPYGLVDVKQH